MSGEKFVTGGKDLDIRMYDAETNQVQYKLLVEFQRMLLFTARIRRMGEGNVSVCVSPHRLGGGGTAIRSWWGAGSPSSFLTWGVPPTFPTEGYPIIPNGGTPIPGQDSVYLLRGGRYASCVHAGLSCSKWLTPKTEIALDVYRHWILH